MGSEERKNILGLIYEWDFLQLNFNPLSGSLCYTVGPVQWEDTVSEHTDKGNGLAIIYFERSGDKQRDTCATELDTNPLPLYMH